MPHTVTIPRYIALCGNPGSGKSTVQRILQESYGVTPVDDGFALRSIAVEHFGLTWHQVKTQEGKQEIVSIAGRDWVVRDFLGQLGNRVEDLTGAWGIPFLAERTVADKPGSFSFGSVRRDQGSFYRQKGGIVLGLDNPNVPPSPYEFDRFDPTIVDAWIRNDGVSLSNLEAQVYEALRHVEWVKAAMPGDEILMGLPA